VHTTFVDRLQTLLADPEDRSIRAKRIAEAIAAERHYRWVALYEVTTSEIGMIALHRRYPAGLSAFSRDPRSLRRRWLTTFGTTRSEIIVPVFEQGLDRPIGLIDIESDQLNAFATDDERFLTSRASFLAPLYR
jgi:hypothetical protein